MAEFKRLPTQDELSRMLYLQQLTGKSGTEIFNENLNAGSTVKSLPDNFFQRLSSGANTAKKGVNDFGAYLGVPNLSAATKKLFPGYVGNSKVSIPTGFNFAPKQDPMGGVVPQGLQTQQVNVDQLLKAIKPADLTPIPAYEKIYGDIGAGNAPKPLDVAEVAATAFVPAKAGMAAGKGLLNVAEATKGLPVGMSIKDVSKASTILPDESFVKGVKSGEEMFVQHNLSADKLIKADKLGGMPVPSLAISKSGAPLEGFGDITLVGSKELASPSAKNPVYKSDAYTKTRPYIEYKIDRKSEDNLKNIFFDVFDKVPDANHSFYRVFDKWNERGNEDIFRAKFLNEKGLLPNKNEFKQSYEFSDEMGNIIRQLKPEYETWLNNFDNSLPDLGVNVKETIFKGRTSSGKARYAPVTLENIVKEMKGGAGSQNWHGVGQLRAVATPRFKNFAEVKASREKLLSGEEMSKIKEQSDSAYNDLTNRLYELKRYRADDALLEVAETKSLSALDRIYGDKMTPEIKADVYTYLNKLKELPTEYFEIKPQRAMDIGEFAGAIIPVDSPKSVRDILQKRGVQNVYEYSTPQERKDLIKKFGKEMFAAAPVTGGLLGSQEERK